VFNPSCVRILFLQLILILEIAAVHAALVSFLPKFDEYQNKLIEATQKGKRFENLSSYCSSLQRYKKD
jgi:hypothetical protein